MQFTKRFFLLLVVLVSATVMMGSSLGGYHLLQKIAVPSDPMPGNGRWDYATVDESARRLYVAHSTQVEVINIDSGSFVGAIPKTEGVHGIAIAAKVGRGFISNGRASTVTIFDLKSLKPLGEVKTGENPDAIVYDPPSGRVFAFNGRSSSATAIDASDGKVVGTVELDGRPEFAVSDGTGYLFDNLEDKSVLLKIDSKNLTVKERWPLAPCEKPSSMALDRKNRRLFIGCGNHLMAVVNPDTGRVITTLPIGDGVDASAWDPATGLVFSSCGDGTITVIHQDSPDKYTVVETLKTQPGSETMALDSKTHKLFAAAATFEPAAAPTPEQPRPRPRVIPGTFTILVFGK